MFLAQVRVITLVCTVQLKYLVGVEIPRGSQLQAVAVHLWQQAADMRWRELLMGCCWLAILFGQRILTNIHRSVSPLAGSSQVYAAHQGVTHKMEAKPDMHVCCAYYLVNHPGLCLDVWVLGVPGAWAASEFV